MRRPTKGEESAVERPDWRNTLWTGTVLSVVAIVLLLGAVLRSDTHPTPSPTATEPEPTIAALTPPPAPAFERTLEPVPTEAPSSALPSPPPPPADSLATRGAQDAARLGRPGGSFTLQLGLLCDADRVRALVERHGSSAALHVLPTRHQGQPCHRVVWGRYPTLDAARIGADLPPDLRASGAFPKSVDEVLR